MLKDRAVQNITDGKSTLAVPFKGLWSNLGGAGFEHPASFDSTDAIIVVVGCMADIACLIRLCLPVKIPLAVCFERLSFSALE